MRVAVRIAPPPKRVASRSRAVSPEAVPQVHGDALALAPTVGPAVHQGEVGQGGVRARLAVVALLVTGTVDAVGAPAAVVDV